LLLPFLSQNYHQGVFSSKIKIKFKDIGPITKIKSGNLTAREIENVDVRPQSTKKSELFGSTQQLVEKESCKGFSI